MKVQEELFIKIPTFNGLIQKIKVVLKKDSGHTKKHFSEILISLHLPKTGGISFLACIEQHFEDSLLKDYYSLPKKTPENIRKYLRKKTSLHSSLSNAKKNFNGIGCIHGHFLPLKYLLLASKRSLKFVTWMRNPVERLVSHYFYWKSNFEPNSSPGLQSKMIKEEWSLKRFCLGPEVRNIYTQYLWGFPLEYFDFIGITEFYEEDLQYFGKHFLNTSLEVQKLNVGNEGNGGYKIDPSFRKEIETFHAKDMELYQRALEMRQKRI
ncbi:MAG: hypothetical protein HXX09_15345 [Bacteroidetes bacterium]|nr:hypothetical protein [Bacteroidota bacterium]